MKAYFASVVAILITAQPPVRGQSPDGPKMPLGVPTNAKFFDGKWYHIYLSRVGWRAARDKCKQTGGQLAVVPDEATHTFLKNLANGVQLWLGATDEKVEGLWTWVDGTEMRFKAWNYGEPNNKHGHEHYLQINPEGTWNDVSETEKIVVGYICEWKAK
jgi:hypothetical protein